MSEFNSKHLREKNKAKARRMANGSGPGDDPTKSIDASGWKEPTNENANAQTGMRPVSRRQFKKGGMVVHGEKAACRADRKPRKSGGRAAEYVNRDVRAANHEIAKPHAGGFKAGGSANFRKQMHSDVGEDKRLIKHMVKKDSLRVAKRNGGGKFAARPHKADGGMAAGSTNDRNREDYARQSRDDSATSQSAREAMGRKRGGRAHKAGGGVLEDVLSGGLGGGGALGAKKLLNLKKGGAANDQTGMRPKGDRIARKSGGRTKGGKTNIVIAIHGNQPQQPQAMQPPMPVRPAMPPQTPPPGPPGAPPGMPPGGMPPGMPPMGLGAGGPQMPMPRKRGGRTYSKLEAGGGSGLGRLQKTREAERTYGGVK